MLCIKDKRNFTLELWSKSGGLFVLDNVSPNNIMADENMLAIIENDNTMGIYNHNDWQRMLLIFKDEEADEIERSE